MTSTVTSWTGLSFALLGSRATYLQHHEKVPVRCWRGATLFSASRQSPRYSDARDSRILDIMVMSLSGGVRDKVEEVVFFFFFFFCGCFVCVVVLSAPLVSASRLCPWYL